jgi:hypothetical protein
MERRVERVHQATGGVWNMDNRAKPVEHKFCDFLVQLQQINQGLQGGTNVLMQV